MNQEGHLENNEIMQVFGTASGDNISLKEKHIIKISRGPQFRTKGGVVLAMLFLFFFILSIAMVSNLQFLVSLISLIMSFVLFSLIIDIHGIEVDTNAHKIRDYKTFLWFRIGSWENINDFKFIYVTQQNVVTRSLEYSNQGSETYHYYFIKLVNELNKKEIVLAEFKNYYKAQHIARGIAESTGLELKDFLKRRK